MSSYPFFIPEFVLCTNSSLFSFKIANEPSEFRNYLVKVNSSRSILKAEITLCHCIPHLFQTEKRRKPHFYDSRLFTCSVQYFPLASQSFWTFSLLFSPLYPFSSAQFGISLWFHVHFGLFSCFSLLYVHFHLLSSVFLSSFAFILDFFLLFSVLCPYGRVRKTADYEKLH